jgi:lysozyme
MISRRTLLSSSLAASAVAGCSTNRTIAPPYQMPIAPPPPDRATLGLDAVIDLSRGVTVTSFGQVRQSGILGVIHKASEGGDYADTAYAGRPLAGRGGGPAVGRLSFRHRPDAGRAAGGVLSFHVAAGTRTLLALDLEANENNPSNSMRLDQAEAFVQAVAQATGRLPVVYVHPTWANGEPLPNSGLSLGAVVTPASILARCGLWVADYHDSPEVPRAWEATGWKLWQYCRRRERGPPSLRPDHHRAGRQPLRSQPVQRDAGALRGFWARAPEPREWRTLTAP